MKGWRTVLLNLACMAVLMTDYLLGASGIWPQLLDNPKHATAVVLGINLLNIALRFVTNTPVGKKE